MNQQKIKLQPEDIRFGGPGQFFVEYKLNGGIATYGGTFKEIKEDLNYYLGKGKYILIYKQIKNERKDK